jgi:hypothetical protein
MHGNPPYLHRMLAQKPAGQYLILPKNWPMRDIVMK